MIDAKNQPEYKDAKELDSIIIGDDKNIKEEEIVDKETNVGKKLSDLTTKRVVIIVMLLMISIPIFNTETYFTDKSIYE